MPIKPFSQENKFDLRKLLLYLLTLVVLDGLVLIFLGGVAIFVIPPLDIILIIAFAIDEYKYYQYWKQRK
jgi:hypothetical protein